MEKDKYKYGVMYTDGGWRSDANGTAGGFGVHGYAFNSLDSVRIAGVPMLVTPGHYDAKPTGAELKDDAYDKTWTAFGYTKTLKADKVIKEGSDVKVIDLAIGSRGIPNAQVAELKAFISAVNDLPVETEYLTVLSDSNYLIQGITSYMKRWKAKGWTKADGSSVKNLELWQEIDDIVSIYGDKLELVKVAAHTGDFGNEVADDLATAGVFGARTHGEVESLVMNDAYDKGYWGGDRPVPPILNVKFCYTLTGGERESVKVGDVDYKLYLVGNHTNSSPDDIKLVCKQLSDSMLGLVLTNAKCTIIDEIVNHHGSIMWKDEDHELDRYETYAMVSVANINAPKTINALNKLPITCLGTVDNRDELITYEDKALSVMVRPPRLSYRLEEREDAAKELLQKGLATAGIDVEAPEKAPEVTLTDITDSIYTTDAKGNIKANKDYQEKLVLDVDAKVSKKPVAVAFSANIDMPDRNYFGKLASPDTKVYVMTWDFGKIAFKYAILLISDSGYGIFYSHDRNKRVLGK